MMYDVCMYDVYEINGKNILTMVLPKLKILQIIRRIQLITDDRVKFIIENTKII